VFDILVPSIYATSERYIYLPMPNVVPCSPVEVRAESCRLPISLLNDDEVR